MFLDFDEFSLAFVYPLEGSGSDSESFEINDLISDCFEHPFDLMIFPFCDGQEDFLFFKLLDFCWFGKVAIIKLNSILELFVVCKVDR